MPSPEQWSVLCALQGAQDEPLEYRKQIIKLRTFATGVYKKIIIIIKIKPTLAFLIFLDLSWHHHSIYVSDTSSISGTGRNSEGKIG